MTNDSIILMTGITSGLGLEAAKQLTANPGTHIITGVRSQRASDALKSALQGDRCTAFSLDQASLASTRQFAEHVAKWRAGRPLAAMVLNAGLQITTGLETTEDGVETTFAVNHLSHWLLQDMLTPALAPDARVIFTASGTHDPDDPVAKKFDFRGGFFPSADAVATGKIDPEASKDQQCLDRYATSKLCNLMTMLALSRTDNSHTYLAFDPGLMPGTHLARDRSAMVRFAWHNIMPLLRPIMKGVSGPKQSGKTLANLATGRLKAATGSYIEYTGARLTPSALARDIDKQKDLIRHSRRLTQINEH